MYLVHALFIFYIQGVLKLKNNSGAKRLTCTDTGPNLTILINASNIFFHRWTTVPGSNLELTSYTIN